MYLSDHQVSLKRYIQHTSHPFSSFEGLSEPSWISGKRHGHLLHGLGDAGLSRHSVASPVGYKGTPKFDRGLNTTLPLCLTAMLIATASIAEHAVCSSKRLLTEHRTVSSHSILTKTHESGSLRPALSLINANSNLESAGLALLR